MRFAARIAELEKAVTAIPKVARTIAHALRAKLFGEAQEPSQAPSTELQHPEAPTSASTTRVDESNRVDRDLPQAYGRNRLVMMVVDPRQVHAYWEVTPQKLAESREMLGSAGLFPAVLRFYDTAAFGSAQASPSSFDVPVDLQSRNWYVHLWSPDKSYYAELGLKHDTGQFVPLAKSNVVRTPRALPVVQVEEHFMSVDSVQLRAERISPPAFVRPHRDRPSTSGDQPLTSSDQHFKSSEQRGAQSPLGFPPASEVRPPARINSEEIMKGKLAELFAVRLASYGRSQVQEASTAQASDCNLTDLVEEHFHAGIFSHPPRKTTDET